MKSEFNRKLLQVRALLKSARADAALIGRQANFSWLAAGGEAHVALNSERAVAHWLVTHDTVYLFTNRIEIGRLRAEELAGLRFTPVRFEWHDTPGQANYLRHLLDPKRIISDTGDWGTCARPELFAPLRYALQPEEIKRLRALGRDAEGAMNETCHAIRPGQSEFELAGELAQACWRRQLTPVVLLIAVDERIRRYRHPLPTKTKLKRQAMLVLCARRHGLIVSATRLVYFGRLPAELRRRHRAVCAVDAVFICNTRVGTPIKEIFQRGVAAYTKQGFAREWQLHHQGGPCGYEPRDLIATPDTPGDVLPNQAFAWNPSITGTKSEDTILATANGPQLVTPAQNWPMLEVECAGKTLLRPDILVR